ncbi:MAG: NUDIX hydrolase [Rhizobiaceae bacterium]|jgi:ADP-ribose pyrophosphatase YjhB (NUDIX family)|nr:NUDIX hydrolase [Rhizobiaceae bacterium]
MSLSPAFSRRTPDGDAMERAICDHCGHVAYENPKIVVGSVVLHEGRVLLCRRAIEPRRGFWTVPAGYMELNETPEDGARREAREEAMAQITLGPLLAVYSVPKLSQVQLIYMATLDRGIHAAGPESLETRLFSFDALPDGDIAFPTVHWMLADARRVIEGRATPPFANPAGF